MSIDTSSLSAASVDILKTVDVITHNQAKGLMGFIAIYFVITVWLYPKWKKRKSRKDKEYFRKSNDNDLKF